MTGGFLRLPREVVRHPLGWVVTFSEFWTTDVTLAEAVRDELDIRDPVQGPPCLHRGDLVSDRTLGDPRDMRICRDCGSTLEVMPDGVLRLVEP